MIEYFYKVAKILRNMTVKLLVVQHEGYTAHQESVTDTKTEA